MYYQEFLGLGVVREANSRGRNEKFKWVVLVRVDEALLDALLDHFHALFLVRRESELLLIAPQNARTGLYCHFGKHVVEIDYLVAAFVADQQKERAMVVFDSIFQQLANSRVHLLLHILV